MTFDYFNPSNLAFGAKLTTVFTQLNNLADSAEENLEQVFAQQEFLEMYDNKNYPCARPTQPYNPTRSTEFYDILNDRALIINELYYDSSSQKIKCDITMFDRQTNRITRGRGETELKEGICYVKKAISNTSPFRELTFTEEDILGSGIELFRFRLDSDNNLNLIGDLTTMHLTPYDCSQYRGLEYGGQLAGDNQTYTSNDYQCVCIVGKPRDIVVKLNDRVVLKGQGNVVTRNCILYLKPGDTISGSYSRIFRIKYTIGNPIYRDLITYYWTKDITQSDDRFTASDSVVPFSGSATGYKDSSYTIKDGDKIITGNAGFITSDRNMSLWQPGYTQNMSKITLTPEQGKGFYESDPQELESINIKGFSGDGQYSSIEANIVDRNGLVIENVTTEFTYGQGYYYDPEFYPEPTDIEKLAVHNIQFTKKIPNGGRIELTYKRKAGTSTMYVSGSSFYIMNFSVSVIETSEGGN